MRNQRILKRLPAVTRARRFANATLLATSMTVCIVPMGCAGSDEQPQAPEHPSNRSLPESTVAALQACADEGAGRLSRHAYNLYFEVDATSRRVRDVVQKGERLDDAVLDRCMLDALQAMPVTALIPNEGSEPAVSQSILPPARSLIGNVSVLPALIELAPIVVTGPGVTIVVSVGVLVLAAAVSSGGGGMSQECKEEWRSARAKCLDLLDSEDPPRGVTGGYKSVHDCARGNVSEKCGGNRVDWGGQGARPGRRT